MCDDRRRIWSRGETMTVPIILDTDPGVDDAVAIMLAAASPEVDLLAITTVFGNVDLETTTANALRLRALAGLGHVPVAAGAARPLVYPQAVRAAQWHATDGLGGRAGELPEPEGPVHARGAVALMADLLRAAPAPVTLVPIGPLTNIALLLAAHPDVKPRIARIVAMGGALSGGNTTESAGGVIAYGPGSDTSPMGPPCLDSPDRTRRPRIRTQCSTPPDPRLENAIEELDRYLPRCKNSASFTHPLHREQGRRSWTALIEV